MSTCVNNERKLNYWKVLPAGIIAASADVGLRAIIKKNRGDTFVKTIKNCTRDYTKEYRSGISSFCGDFLGMKNFSKWMNGIGNKKMFAFLFATDVLITSLILKGCHNLFCKKKSK